MMASNSLSVALIHSLRLSSDLRSLEDLRVTDRWRSAVRLVALWLVDFTGSEFWEAREAEKTAALGWDETMTPRSSHRLFRHVSPARLLRDLTDCLGLPASHSEAALFKAPGGRILNSANTIFVSLRLQISL